MVGMAFLLSGRSIIIRTRGIIKLPGIDTDASQERHGEQLGKVAKAFR
jgi:hypothetical protein